MKLGALTLAGILFLVAGCQPAPPATPAPGTSSDQLVVWERSDVDGVTTVYARNDSKATITVAKLWLYDCKNVGRECGEVPVNLSVKPAETQVLLRITPAPHGGTMRFQYEIRYQ